ncbi:hypothetical protein E4T44_08320 [Aureobasidium sp. EXF-8845]|nr:hypothetical protein E4T44_08320 [Aureobasidium sp. EXF-8845]
MWTGPLRLSGRLSAGLGISYKFLTLSSRTGQPPYYYFSVSIPYAENFAKVHRSTLGQSIGEVWDAEAFKTIVPSIETAESQGRRIEIEARPCVSGRRCEYSEETYVSYTVTPLVGLVPGVHMVFTDLTTSVLAAQRRETLQAFSASWNLIADAKELWESVLHSLVSAPLLYPSAFLYVADYETEAVRFSDFLSTTGQMPLELRGTVGEAASSWSLPQHLGLGGLDLSLEGPQLVRSGSTRAMSLPSLAQDFIMCPVRPNGFTHILAVLYLGIDSKRPYNRVYQSWAQDLIVCLQNAVTSVLLHQNLRKSRDCDNRMAEEQVTVATTLAMRERDTKSNSVSDQPRSTLEVMDMAGVGIFEYNNQGQLVYGNQSFIKLTGCPDDGSSSDMLAFLKWTYPEDHKYLMSKWNRGVGGESCTFEMRFRSPYNQCVWVQAAIVPVYGDGIVQSISGCLTNIHASKLRESESLERLKELESWENRFANFAEMAPIAIYFGSGVQPSLSYCNRSWFEMTGHPVVPFEEVDWTSTIHEEDVEIVRHHWDQALTLNGPSSVQYRLKRRWTDTNGVSIGPMWVTVSTLPEHRQDGSCAGIIGTMLDISALKFAETVQQTKFQEAMEAKRQSSNFIDMTSHEIRNPLGAVFHCSDALQETLSEMAQLAKGFGLTEETDKGKRFQELIASSVDSVSTILSCSQHQKRIVDDILVLSKLDSNLLQIVPSAVRVTALLRDVENMFEARAQRDGVQIVTKAHASLTELALD